MHVRRRFPVLCFKEAIVLDQFLGCWIQIKETDSDLGCWFWLVPSSVGTVSAAKYLHIQDAHQTRSGDMNSFTFTWCLNNKWIDQFSLVSNNCSNYSKYWFGITEKPAQACPVFCLKLCYCGVMELERLVFVFSNPGTWYLEFFNSLTKNNKSKK